MPDNSVASGPVHMPAMGPNTGSMQKTTASTEEHGNSLGHEAKHEIYTVKITDSYKKIAYAHNVTVAELKEANHIKGDVLHTGQKLVIPSEKTLVAATATTTATVATVAERNLSPGDLYDTISVVDGRLLLSGGHGEGGSLLPSGAGAASPHSQPGRCETAEVDPASLTLSDEQRGSCEDPLI